MIRIRRSADRGHFRNHWLDARFSFSFGDYQDRAFDGYSDLMVLNEDRVAPGGGFVEHGHRDVEVMSYPVSGAVEHRDSLGNVAIMRPNDVHLMRAGRGIRHSEMNASDREPEHHLQWWIRPAASGLEPGYQRLSVPAADKHNRWRLLASPTGEARRSGHRTGCARAGSPGRRNVPELPRESRDGESICTSSRARHRSAANGSWRATQRSSRVSPQ